MISNFKLLFNDMVPKFKTCIAYFDVRIRACLVSLTFLKLDIRLVAEKSSYLQGQLLLVVPGRL